MNCFSPKLAFYLLFPMVKTQLSPNNFLTVETQPIWQLSPYEKLDSVKMTHSLVYRNMRRSSAVWPSWAGLLLATFFCYYSTALSTPLVLL